MQQKVHNDLEVSNEQLQIYAVVRVRGIIGVRDTIRETLRRLKLTKPNHCVLVKITDSMIGMLKKSKDYITWGEIDTPTLKLLIEKRCKKSHIEKIQNIFSGKFKCDFVFRLNPPKKGYKSIKKSYKEGGALGYRGEKINNLIQRMI